MSQSIVPYSHPNQKLRIERPLSRSFAPYALANDYIFMIPLMPEHRFKLYEEIFSQPQVVKYLGFGKTPSEDSFTLDYINQAKQNLYPLHDRYSGNVKRFSWTIITRDGIAGQLDIYPTRGAGLEIAYCISPTQQGKALARRASELAINYVSGDKNNGISWVATAHPNNKASAKTLEQLRYQDGQFVFYRDLTRQNVPRVYGKNQPRDYFISKDTNRFSFFSFKRGIVEVNPACKHELSNY